MLDLRRREFIALLGLVVWTFAARAQQQPVGKPARRLGMLLPGEPPEPLVEALRERLRELGYTEGRDLVLELRWAQGKKRASS
jgi:putative tryptophan/tyrosine transport system substrate-binding protein